MWCSSRQCKVDQLNSPLQAVLDCDWALAYGHRSAAAFVVRGAACEALSWFARPAGPAYLLVSDCAVAVWDILPGKAHRKLGNLREAIADADEAGKGWGNFSALAGCMQSDPQEANFHGDLARNLFICNLASDVLQIAYTTLAWRRFRDWPGIARMPQFLRSPGASGSGRVRWVGLTLLRIPGDLAAWGAPVSRRTLIEQHQQQGPSDGRELLTSLANVKTTPMYNYIIYIYNIYIYIILFQFYALKAEPQLSLMCCSAVSTGSVGVAGGQCCPHGPQQGLDLLVRNDWRFFRMIYRRFIET